MVGGESVAVASPAVAAAAAASAEAAAIAAYNIAIQRLERAKGTLLKYNNVVVEDDYFPGRDAK